MITQIKLKAGKIVDNDYDKLLKSLPDGVYTLKFKHIGKPRTIKEYQKYYFYICELVADEAQTGYTKKELHELFKDKILFKDINRTYFVDNLSDFINYQDNSISYQKTTKLLNLLGWEIYLENVKNYVKENLNFFI